MSNTFSILNYFLFIILLLWKSLRCVRSLSIKIMFINFLLKYWTMVLVPIFSIFRRLKLLKLRKILCFEPFYLFKSRLCYLAFLFDILEYLFRCQRPFKKYLLLFYTILWYIEFITLRFHCLKPNLTNNFNLIHFFTRVWNDE